MLTMGTNSENSHLQADEIEALAAIYEENFIPGGESSFQIKIGSKPGKEVLLNKLRELVECRLPLEVNLPKGYPIECPPTYQISAPWMSRESKQILNDEIQEIYRNNLGECIIHLWIVTITDFIETLKVNEEQQHKISEECDIADVEANSEPSVDVNSNVELSDLPHVEHGEPIIDKKSVFQAHLARITSEKEVPLILGKLKESKKISSATHNTYAYRISLPNGSVIEGIEDDGEKKAGAVLLRILQFSNLTDILIVVSRWYGGIHLGADRFKDYSNAARNLINHLELIQNPKNKDFKEKLRK